MRSVNEEIPGRGALIKLLRDLSGLFSGSEEQMGSCERILTLHACEKATYTVFETFFDPPLKLSRYMKAAGISQGSVNLFFFVFHSVISLVFPSITHPQCVTGSPICCSQ